MDDRNSARQRTAGEGIDSATAPPARSSGTRLVRARLPSDGAEEGRGLGPESTVEEIYVACCGRVFARLLRLGVPRHDAMDLIHDVFLTLHVQKEAGTVARDVSALLGTLTLRRFWNYARVRRAARRRDGGSEMNELPAFRPDPEESVYGEELRRIVDEILARMPEHHAQIIRLVDFAEMSHEDVAAGLGCTSEALRSRLYRARSVFNDIAEVVLGQELGGAR